jgi:hypothetical protein
MIGDGGPTSSSFSLAAKIGLAISASMSVSSLSELDSSGSYVLQENGNLDTFVVFVQVSTLSRVE